MTFLFLFLSLFYPWGVSFDVGKEENTAKVHSLKAVLLLLLPCFVCLQNLVEYRQEGAVELCIFHTCLCVQIESINSIFFIISINTL